MKEHNITAPKAIDQYIQNGIHKGKQYKKRKRQGYTSMIATLGLALLLVTCIKVSPAFANAVRDIPGLSAIVELIEGDKGLEDAVENDFIHQINSSDIHSEITFSIDHIIVDQARMILFYSIKTEREHNFLFLKDLELFGDGEPLMASISYGAPKESVDLQKNKQMNGKIVATFSDQIDVPDELTVSTQFKARTIQNKIPDQGSILDAAWKVKFAINDEWYKNTREEIAIDKEVKIDGQTMHFEKAVIDPTLTAIYVKFDPQNEMQLFTFDDLKIVDDSGEVWSPPDGLVSTGSDDKFILYYESPHFRTPKELYLKGSSIRAIDEDEQTIVVDLTNKKLTKAPSDGRIQLKDLQVVGDRVELEFAVKVEPQDEYHIYEIFNQQPINLDSSVQHGRTLKTWQKPEENKVVHKFSINNPDRKTKIVLELKDYPSRLVEPFKIQVK
ncbi:DUF4179 domain-containing protein [Alkalihalobacillus sp. AL-G]|uniref:DUF4179 domain-containing protein n=1 Tax=Alkalihalobacillus sp. AL-G TaxID=2926399 RepID=UPI002729F107|nr:DUF4179 domain-containing protein [Alkalihalobacillus sp. AL-G]WLD92524.1 DUF4179 domain-containing protein [Alkalihalobacillus sp. AL-G]